MSKYTIRSNTQPDTPCFYDNRGKVVEFSTPQDALFAIAADLKSYLGWEQKLVGEWFRCVDENGNIAWTVVING